MAVSVSNLTSGGSDTDATSYTTASVSPSANTLQLLTVASTTRITTDPNQPTVTGNGLTWVAINTVVFDNTSSSRRRITTFRAMGSSPSSGTITIDFGGQTQTSGVWVLDELSGTDTSGTNGSGAVVQSAVNSEPVNFVTSLTMTLGAFSSSDNATYGVYGNGNTNTITAGSGFAMVAHNNSPADGLGAWTEFRADNDTSVNFTFSSDTELGGIAIEIKAAAAGGSTYPGYYGSGGYF